MLIFFIEVFIPESLFHCLNHHKECDCDKRHDDYECDQQNAE